MFRRLSATTCAAALAFALGGCGEKDASSGAVVPVERPTAVPAAEGTVTTSSAVIVSDDGSGPQLCFGGTSFGGPPSCADASVTGWDWEQAGDVSEDAGVRWGTYVLTGSFDGEHFAVTEVDQPSREPEPFDFTIPCPEADDGWRVADPARSGQDQLAMLSTVAERLDGLALVAVSTPDGQPGPRDPENTVVSVYVAEDPTGAEQKLREVWGGMLCVTQVEHSLAELERVQQELIGLPGLISVGSGSPTNEVELTVFHDDGRYQRWVDEEYGEGLVVVDSTLQPTG